MVKQNLRKIMFMAFNITNLFEWWMHAQYLEDVKVCKNANYQFIWKCVLWHLKKYSHFLFLFCTYAGVLMNFRQWVHLGIISLWEEGFHSIKKKGCMEITESYRRKYRPLFESIVACEDGNQKGDLPPNFISF